MAADFRVAVAEFLAAGQVLRPGRTLTVCQADVFALRAGERVLVATMLSTIIVRPVDRGTPPAR